MQLHRQWIDDVIDQSGLPSDDVPARFRQSLEIMSAGKAVYTQQPQVYYFPGLPQVQFFDPQDFGWAAEVESRTERILAELRALLDDPGSFSAHVPANGEAPRRRRDALAGNSGWSSFYFWHLGELVRANAERCPAVMEALSHVPLPHFSRTSPSAPSVMFSMLRAGTRIPPHCGSTNVRLICHLPLIVPPGCGFRVGNEVREWEVGKLLIFDDTIEHEAWNNGSDDRVVLIFDIWRPDLSDAERAAVTALFRHRERTARPRG